MAKQKYTAANLVVGKVYRVVAAFQDYDGKTHEVGESWRFIGQNFVPYEDGLTLFLEKEGVPVHLRLQWRRETQASVIDGFSDFVEEF